MSPASPTHNNIRAIAALEKQTLEQRSLSVRAADAVARQAGRMRFIVLHACWFAVWIGVNSSGKPDLVFDPFPFSFLTMTVSLEAIFLSLFILMSQNRSNMLAEQRNHLDLQINLLAEDENTKIIQMLQAICEHHQLPICHDSEIRAMACRTEVHEVMQDLQENLPGNE